MKLYGDSSNFAGFGYAESGQSIDDVLYLPIEMIEVWRPAVHKTGVEDGLEAGDKRF